MAPKSSDWFEVSRDGLLKILSRRGKAWALNELLQNAWDTDATEVIVTFEPVANTPKVWIAVEDNSSTGYKDLSHAFTMFADSAKKGDATKRGRFNIGCKFALAICSQATITSMNGSVVFDEKGRHSSKVACPRGSRFRGLASLTRAEFDEILEQTKLLIPPTGVKTIITVIALDGKEEDHVLAQREPTLVIEETLPTEIADAEGALRRTARKTAVQLFHADGQAFLYELGIPVTPIEGPWHANVMQKVPLTIERDAAPPGYLVKLQTAILNATADQLQPDQFTAPWVAEAVESKDIAPAVLDRYLGAKYGEKRLANDPNNQEGMRRAVAAGFTIVHGRSESGETWKRIREHKLADSVTALFPPPTSSSNYTTVELKDLPENYLSAMDYARKLIWKLLGIQTVTIRVIDGGTNINTLATWQRGEVPTLTLNRTLLGKGFFAKGPTIKVNELLIHEMAHQSGDHLEEKFDDAMAYLGAKMTDLALREPRFFLSFIKT